MTPFSGERYCLTAGGSLTWGQLRHVCWTMINGGLCIIPSDTCYALAGIASRWDVIAKLVQVLPEKKNSEIPLAFGSMRMVEEWVSLTVEDQRIIESNCPGPITLVCHIKPSLDVSRLSQLLNTSGTIGIRLPDSNVEKQISVELNSPITTCAIRDNNGNHVVKYDEAVDIIRDNLSKIDITVTLAAIQMNCMNYPKEDSTVFTVEPDLARPYSVRIYRQGAVDKNIIKKTLGETSFWEISELT